MYFHLKKKINYIDFLKNAGKCNSEVYYETKDGDRLELHSAFCQFIFMDLIRRDAKKGTVCLKDPQDFSFLGDFLEEADEY